MIFLNRQRFMEEVENFLKNKKLNREDFETLFKVANNEIKINNAVGFCDELIKKMFGTVYKEELIPWRFFDLEVGRAIITIKYGYNSDIFFVREIADFMGRTRQYVNSEIKSKNLKAYKRCGNFIVYRKDLEDYFYKKNMDKNCFYEQIQEKIIIPDDREEKYDTE